MNHKLLQQALDALNGGLYRSDSIVKAIEALEVELAKPEQDYIKKLEDDFREQLDQLSERNYKLRMELADAKLAQPEPVVSFTDNEEGLWIQLECNGAYYSQNLSESKTAKFFVNAYRKKNGAT